jgi:hypothetical protein
VVAGEGATSGAEAEDHRSGHTCVATGHDWGFQTSRLNPSPRTRISFSRPPLRSRDELLPAFLSWEQDGAHFWTKVVVSQAAGGVASWSPAQRLLRDPRGEEEEATLEVVVGVSLPPLPLRPPSCRQDCLRAVGQVAGGALPLFWEERRQHLCGKEEEEVPSVGGAWS